MAIGRWTVPLATLLAFAPFSPSLCSDDLTALFDDASRVHLGASLSTKPVVSRADDDRLYSEVSFAATHNSYAVASGVGSIRAQLDRGVRLIEFDIHDDDYSRFGYRLGHSDVGDKVFHGDGNPDGNGLREWLALIDDWSDAHRGHAPITLILDLKDSLVDNDSYTEGNLLALNDELTRALGSKLYWASDVEAHGWATIGALRGRVLAVLSGSERTRVAYRGVRAMHPSVAMNAKGDVVEAHDSGKGELWYWTGKRQDDGTIAWRRNGRYDTGQNPALDLADDGTIVEVHEDPDLDDYQLWYRVGRLDEAGEIHWANANGLPFPDGDGGVTPTVRITDVSRGKIREVHRSQYSDRRCYWDGTIDGTLGTIAWTRGDGDRGKTDDPLFAKRAASKDGRSIEVFTGEDGSFGSDTLLYKTDRLPRARIRPSQLAFVEFQHGGTRELQNDGLFFCAGSADEPVTRSWAGAWRSAGKIARLWQFNARGSAYESAAVSFPATDLPFSDWYDEYCHLLGCVR
jgi:hypothetical protein